MLVNKMGKAKQNPAKKKAAAAKPAKKAKAAAKAPARKPVKPAPKKIARAKAPVRKAAKPAQKAAIKKPAKALPKAAAKPARHAPKPLQQAPRKTAVNTKNGKMSAVIEKDSVTREDGRYALPSTTVIALPAGYHPLEREEYMGPRQLAYFRAKLQKWREDLVEESKQTIDNLRDEVRDVGDEAERATRETENSLELRTRDRYRKLIAKIDKALKRIEEGRYGFCEETDEEIGIERLDARPIATLCLDAQERWEHRQKQMGD